MDEPEYNSLRSYLEDIPLTLEEVELEDSPSGPAMCLCDGDGYILSRNQFESVVRAAREVYERWTEEELHEFNAEVSIKLFEEQEVSMQSGGERVVCPGYVYVLASEGVFKIGRSKDVERRIKGIKASMPVEVHPVGYTWVSDFVSAELELHKIYADKRINGEWFKLDRQDLYDIREFLAERRV